VGTRIRVSKHDSGRLGRGIVASRHDSGASRHDLSRLGEGIVNFEYVQAAARLLEGGILGSNSCKAFCFVLLLA
jgi:hypothetical protein